MDRFTLRHLDAWLERVAWPEEIEDLRARMIALVEEDPSLLDLGWPRIRDIAEGR